MPNHPTRVVLVLLVLSVPSALRGAEVLELSAENWNTYAPLGKEVDAIYGDYVLRSDTLVAVVARPGEHRHANMTVRDVGGGVIDLTTREKPSDQLSAFYPLGRQFVFSGPVPWPDGLPQLGDGGAARIAFQGKPTAVDAAGTVPSLEAVVGYELHDDEDCLTAISHIRNVGEQPTSIELYDSVRADGEFEFGFDEESNLWWARDSYWEQAYGVLPADGPFQIRAKWNGQPRDPRRIHYVADEQDKVELKPGEAITLVRRIFAGPSDLIVRSRGRVVAHAQVEQEVRARLTDHAGPIGGAFVEVKTKGEPAASLGVARTDDDGRFDTRLPSGEYELAIRVPGRNEVRDISFNVPEGFRHAELETELPVPGYVAGRITDGDGEQIACKVAFNGKDGTPSPNFGPDSAIRGVRNLQYTPNGEFRIELEPGSYTVVASHGPEYNAEIRDVTVTAGEETLFEARLERVVDTTGWLSADFHSHSSPSGDNTSSQRGRVLNLLAEHIEFAPCTEHNRISTYDPHLEFFDATKRMATCTGMELTGQPLPINHQNAFPLIRHPHTQDGGGPRTDVNPVVQIERLAMWDDASEKLMQLNHPNMVQMIGDRDKDGQADGGFERMFTFMDVIEVHPPGDIFKKQQELYVRNDELGNEIFNWLQLMNLGYRIPGVVNTDAHWNYHGSGWLRNYIRSPTDDPAAARIDDLVTASGRGQIVMTNGPFLTVEAENDAGTLAGPGDDLAAGDGKVRLRVRVQCPNWLEVDRVQVFVNGRDEAKYNYTRRRFPEMYQAGPVVFDVDLEIALEEDAHLVVATIGEQGRLGVVYGEEQGELQPVAVANPIFVDIDGDGFEPNGDMLGLPLPVADDHRPSHGHDHPH